MAFSLSIINAAKAIVANSSNKIPANKYNVEVCKIVEVGNPTGSSLLLSRAELRQIENYFTLKLGESLLTYQTKACTRMDMAKLGIDEKSAKGGVFQQLVCLASKSSIPLKYQPDVPKEASYIVSLAASELDFARIKRVIFIENGQLLVCWKQIPALLPDLWKSALFIYRGHGKNQKELPELIKQLDDNDVEIAFFFDYDPAGLDLVELLSSSHHYWIFPERNLNLFKSISKLDSYNDQFKLLEQLKAKVKSHLIKEHLIFIESNAFAITQEHLVNQKIPLTVERLTEY